MGKSTISMAIFNSYVSLPEGIWAGYGCQHDILEAVNKFHWNLLLALVYTNAKRRQKKEQTKREQTRRQKNDKERAATDERREEMQQACYRGRACVSGLLRIAAPAPCTWDMFSFWVWKRCGWQF